MAQAATAAASMTSLIRRLVLVSPTIPGPRRH